MMISCQQSKMCSQLQGSKEPVKKCYVVLHQGCYWRTKFWGLVERLTMLSAFSTKVNNGCDKYYLAGPKKSVLRFTHALFAKQRHLWVHPDVRERYRRVLFSMEDTWHLSPKTTAGRTVITVRNSRSLRGYSRYSKVRSNWYTPCMNR